MDDEDGRSSLGAADANSSGWTSDRAASSVGDTVHDCLPCDENVELFLSLMAPDFGRFWLWVLIQPARFHV